MSKETMDYSIPPLRLARAELTKYSIGPFAIDLEKDTVTLSPGKYTLTQPLTFGLSPDAEPITGVEYVGDHNHEETQG